MSLVLPLTKPVELMELTTAMQQAVPSLEGLTNRVTYLEVRRLTGAFTPQEVALLRQALDVHDASAIQQAKAARKALQVSEKAKVPSTLSLPERVRRLEILLDHD